MASGIKGILQDFKDFAMKGNVVDLAVGVIIGAAFGKIVSSLVNDIMMPPLGLLMGGVDFSKKVITLKAAVTDAATGKVLTPATIISYGVFINNVIDFIIVAFSVFMVVKLLSVWKKVPPTGPPTTKTCPKCMSTIPIGATKCAYCTTDLATA